MLTSNKVVLKCEDCGSTDVKKVVRISGETNIVITRLIKYCATEGILCQCRKCKMLMLITGNDINIL